MANNQRLNAIITVGAAMSGSVRSTMRGVTSRLQSVGREITNIARRQRELDRQRTMWVRQGRDVAELDRELTELGRTMDQLRRRQERLQRVSDGIGRVGAAWGRTGDTIRRQATVIGAAVGAVTSAIGLTTIATSRDIEEQTRWARRIGVTTEFLSGLSYATRQYGVETEDLVDGLKELSLRSDEFAVTGAGPAEEAFRRIGLSQGQVQALAQDTAALFAEVQRRMSSIGSDAERQRISDELFGGTAGERLIEVLQLSQTELAALMAEGERAGAVIDESLAGRARDFSREFGRLGSVMKGVFYTIGGELMPIVTEELGHINDWLIENRHRVSEFALVFVEGVRAAVPVVRDVAAGLLTVGEHIVEIATWMADMLGGWENLGIAVGTAFVAPSIIAVGRLGVAIGMLIAATGPVGLVIAGVAAAAGLIIANWDTIRDAGVAAWEGLRAGAEAAVDWVVDKFQWLAERVTALLQPIKDAFSWVSNTAGTVVDFLTDAPVSPGRGGAGRGATTPPVSNGQTRASPGRGSVQRRASGGPLMPGAAMVGELGRELIFPTRQAFVATARQTGEIASSLGDMGSSLGSRLQGKASGGAGVAQLFDGVQDFLATARHIVAPPASGGGSRTFNLEGITIHAAAGLDPRAIADQVLRVLQDRERSALYDAGM